MSEKFSSSAYEECAVSDPWFWKSPDCGKIASVVDRVSHLHHGKVFRRGEEHFSWKIRKIKRIGLLRGVLEFDFCITLVQWVIWCVGRAWSRLTWSSWESLKHLFHSIEFPFCILLGELFHDIAPLVRKPLVNLLSRFCSDHHRLVSAVIIIMAPKIVFFWQMWLRTKIRARSDQDRRSVGHSRNVATHLLIYFVRSLDQMNIRD